MFFFFKQKTAYEMRISDWSSDVCSSDLAVVIGASFIGMEASAALRARGLDVHVVAPESKPMERVLGPQLGEHLRRLHERNGVAFHLGTSVAAIDDRGVALEGGERIEADLVVEGLGVRPRRSQESSGGTEGVSPSRSRWWTVL